MVKKVVEKVSQNSNIPTEPVVAVEVAVEYIAEIDQRKSTEQVKPDEQVVQLEIIGATPTAVFVEQSPPQQVDKLHVEMRSIQPILEPTLATQISVENTLEMSPKVELEVFMPEITDEGILPQDTVPERSSGTEPIEPVIASTEDQAFEYTEEAVTNEVATQLIMPIDSMQSVELEDSADQQELTLPTEMPNTEWFTDEGSSIGSHDQNSEELRILDTGEISIETGDNLLIPVVLNPIVTLSEAPKPMPVLHSKEIWPQPSVQDLPENTRGKYDSDQPLAVSEQDLTLSLLAIEPRINVEGETKSTSDMTLDQLMVGLDTIEDPALQREGKDVVASMQALTQEIALETDLLRHEIELAYDGTAVPVDLRFMVDQKLSPSLEQIIDRFADIDIDLLPKTVSIEYQRIVQSITELREQSQKLVGIFDIAYDVQTHEITISPKQQKDPMHERKHFGLPGFFYGLDGTFLGLDVSRELGRASLAAV